MFASVLRFIVGGHEIVVALIQLRGAVKVASLAGRGFTALVACAIVLLWSRGR
jgi:hypothetical protein